MPRHTFIRRETSQQKGSGDEQERGEETIDRIERELAEEDSLLVNETEGVAVARKKVREIEQKIGEGLLQERAEKQQRQAIEDKRKDDAAKEANLSLDRSATKKVAHPYTIGESKILGEGMGTIRGFCEDTLCAYINIPYARPLCTGGEARPATANCTPRFNQSVLRTEPYGGDDASGWGPACKQIVPGMDFPGEDSEDCLQLNIWTQKGAWNGSNLPVMVFLHGGDFVYDGAATESKNGRHLAARKMVVVTVQYRLGVFGFYSPYAFNNGITDQLTALRWVNRHISSFGGDSGSVTLVGHGSGASSACLLAHSPHGNGLFQRMVLMSGVCYPSVFPLFTKAQGAQYQSRYFGKMGLTTDDFEKASSETLVRLTRDKFEFDEATLTRNFGKPVVDGKWIEGFPTNHTLNKIDLIIGLTSKDLPTSEWLNDGPVFTLAMSRRKYLKRYLPNASDYQVNQLLHLVEEGTRDRSLMLNICLQCPALRYAKKAKERGGNVFFYIYDHPADNAKHGSDLGALFGGDSSVPEFITDRFQSSLASFATNGTISPDWPQVSALNADFARGMRITANTFAVSNVEPHVCQYLEELNLGYETTFNMCNNHDLEAEQ
jgi:carboxylesterase type B